jgi:proline iminopeptidase
LNHSFGLTEGLARALPKACEFLGRNDAEHCPDKNIPAQQQLMNVYQKLRERNLFWKMGYASKASEDAVTAAMQESPYNYDEENSIMSVNEYFGDFKGTTAKIMVPVLFFSGKTDWMAGVNNYKGVAFPHRMLWRSEVGHVPFVENQADLDRAIGRYQKKYKF